MNRKKWTLIALVGLLAGGGLTRIVWSATGPATSQSSTIVTSAGPSEEAVPLDAAAATVNAAAAPQNAVAAANPAAYLPANQIPAEIDDPPFNRYVDLPVLARAWERKNATLMIDAAIQLMEGERILQRPHHSLSVADLLELATHIAADNHDQGALDRLHRLADQPGETAWKTQLKSTLKLAGEARAIDPGSMVSIEDMSPQAYAAFHRLKSQIEAARIGADAAALSGARHQLDNLKSLPEKQRKYLEKLLADSRSAPHRSSASSVSKLNLLKLSRKGAFRKSSDPPPAAAIEIPADLADPAFDRYVDLSLLGPAWSSADAALLSDVGLQLLEGERVLLRPHRKMPGAKVLELAARVATDRHDQPTLQRLAKVADQQGQPGWKAQVASALKLGGAARAVNPALTISVEDLSPTAYAAFHEYREQIEIARAARDKAALEALKKGLGELTGLPEKQRNYLDQQIGDGLASLKGVTDPQQDALAGALNKLADASRPARGRSPGPSRKPGPARNPGPGRGPGRTPTPGRTPGPGRKPGRNPGNTNVNIPVVINIPRPPVYIPDNSGNSGDSGYVDNSGDSGSDDNSGDSGGSDNSGDTASGDVYAAIAYSPSTGNYATTVGAGSQDEAQTNCLNACQGDDAQVVVWCKNSYCTLAVGDDGSWGACWGDSQEDAEAKAMGNCNQDNNPHVVVTISASGG